MGLLCDFDLVEVWLEMYGNKDGDEMVGYVFNYLCQFFWVCQVV